MNHSDLLQYVENRALDPATRIMVNDQETEGLDWRRHRTCGFVLTFSEDPRDSHYLPIRHKGGANMDEGKVIPLMRRIAARPDLRWVGFNFSFDLRFLAIDGIDPRGPLEDGMINAYLENENRRSFSLAACCRDAGVQEKKEEDVYSYLASRFGGAADRKQMANFHLLAGDDPVGVDYACGDGTSTWRLRDHQVKAIEQEDLTEIWEIECRVIRVLHRMTWRGIRVDLERVEQVRSMVRRQLEQARSRLPRDFNERAPTQLIKVFTDAGVTDFPRTAPSRTRPNGSPSFTEGWLMRSPLGRDIVTVRKLSNLENSFINPLVNDHLYRGRVHCTYNQSRGETHGTVTGRLCLARGSMVMVPGGAVPIENIRKGDWVYTYGDDLRLTLRRVKWSGYTGMRELRRLHWVGQGGKTTGYLDVTPSHEIRLTDGRYVRASDLRGGKFVRWRGRYHGGEHVLAVHRQVKTVGKRRRNFLFATGVKRSFKESRFVFEATNGWLPDHVHHDDENTLNDDPRNLVGKTRSEHISGHSRRISREERQRRSRVRTPEAKARAEDVLREQRVRRMAELDARFSEDAIRAAYSEYGSIRATAKSLGCDYVFLRRRMDELSIDRGRSIPLRHTDAEILGALSGRSPNEAAGYLGYSRLAFLNRLRRAEARSNNHMISRVEDLPGMHEVYDIEVEDTHNFIANELCVHNSCSDPNLQQCPKRNEVLGPLFRSLFVPDEGMLWGSPDYSQIEPRLLAHYGKVRALIDGYLSTPPVDAHSAVARAAGIPRQAGKTLNQALITGSGDDHAIDMLRAQTDLSLDECRGVLRDYFRAMPEIKNWYHMDDGTAVRGGIQKHASNRMKLMGYVRSLMGRRARLDDPRFAYKALNRLLQCGNADILKRSMAEIDDYLVSEGDQVHLLGNIHDSLDFQYPRELEHVYRRCLEMMVEDYGPGRRFDLLVPLEVEEASGANWAEASYSPDVVARAFSSMGGIYDGARIAA